MQGESGPPHTERKQQGVQARTMRVAEEVEAKCNAQYVCGYFMIYGCPWDRRLESHLSSRKDQGPSGVKTGTKESGGRGEGELKRISGNLISENHFCGKTIFLSAGPPWFVSFFGLVQFVHSSPVFEGKFCCGIFPGFKQWTTPPRPDVTKE
jgi:hypothetical protein